MVANGRKADPTRISHFVRDRPKRSLAPGTGSHAGGLRLVVSVSGRHVTDIEPKLVGHLATVQWGTKAITQERFEMKSWKGVAFGIGGLLMLTATVMPASAATVTYDWTLTGPAASLGGVPFPGSGTITATIGADGDLVTAIAGTIDGSAITGLSSFEGADNLLFPTGTTFLDTSGLSFDTAVGQDINIFSFFAEGSTPSGNAYGEISSNPAGFGVGTFELSATPLPAALPLFAGGLGVLVFLAWRKKRSELDGVAAA